MTRKFRLTLALLASAVATATYTFPLSTVATVEVLMIHGFFLIDLLFRPPDCGEGGDPSRWVIVSKIYMVSLLYLPIAFVTIFQRLWGFEVFGLGVTLFGGLLTLWGRMSLGRMAMERLVIIDGHTLFKGGPYRFIRHPIYSGLALAFLGHQLTFMFLPGVLIWILFILLVVRPRIRMEEAMLLERFPEGYSDYQRQTWTLFPCIY